MQRAERAPRSRPFAPVPANVLYLIFGPAPLSLLHKDVAQMEIIEW